MSPLSPNFSKRLVASLAVMLFLKIVIIHLILLLPFLGIVHSFTSIAPPRRPTTTTSKRRPPNGLAVTTTTTTTSTILLVKDDNDGTEEEEDDNNDPDLLGIKIEGFPIPEIPILDDDDSSTIRNKENSCPLTSLDLPDGPLKSRRLITSSQKQRKGEEGFPPLRVLIAGGGIGGLTLGSTLIRQGFDVHILEQAKRYKPFGGPIQIQSNALWALREINPLLYEAVAQVGVQTGDRLSGIKDGKRYEEGWLVKFDAATPALRKGLPLTLAINRVALQEIFLRYGIPPQRVHTNKRVIRYEEHNNNENSGVTVYLQDGTIVHGDILVGCDGIWSRVRHQMYDLPPTEVGPKFATQHATYSGYTCYTGTCQHTPNDISEVAYKVFLGQEQYFGCTDCGFGWQHWWAFLPDPPGGGRGSNKEDEIMLERLKREFDDWSPEIHDLFDSTEPDVVQKRDLFDRPPLTKGWTRQYTALLGDAAHPTMPNLGQGGAMAIEDAYALGQELQGIQHTTEINRRLKAYEKRRYVRASIAQFLSRNGSDLLVDWDTLRNTPIVGPIAMKCVNWFQPLTMNYLYSADI